jgi:hypothetical protein
LEIFPGRAALYGVPGKPDFGLPRQSAATGRLKESFHSAEEPALSGVEGSRAPDCVVRDRKGRGTRCFLRGVKNPNAWGTRLILFQRKKYREATAGVFSAGVAHQPQLAVLLLDQPVGYP